MSILMSNLRANSSSWGRRAIVPSSARISQRRPPGIRPARRARSTAASVCPALRSTPPSTALRGNMCPGRARSSGFVRGSISALTVIALSKADIPVVVPCTASTETVKFVFILAVFSWTIIPSLRWSSLSPRRAAQISPRACLAMKFISSACTFSAAMIRSPSFSLPSSSTTMTIFPRRISPRASSTVHMLLTSIPPLAFRQTGDVFFKDD